MNDFIQLKPQSNVYEAETMVEGTLDGFSFDSEDEADKIPKAVPHQNNQNEDVEEQTNGKNNGKTKRKAEKTLGIARNRGKAVGGKMQAPKMQSSFLERILGLVMANLVTAKHAGCLELLRR
ncbi:DNA-binding protein BIN4-like [Carya illinoinensis]|uniref:DNA-binding protein BIN4-like n=1 Tax=Carya illinoinensis TaxID=32201 RepID=UPI001C718AC9|nr:DNA-binding protein BIN4-like [Carya illinoinensis]